MSKWWKGVWSRVSKGERSEWKLGDVVLLVRIKRLGLFFVECVGKLVEE